MMMTQFERDSILRSCTLGHYKRADLERAGWEGFEIDILEDAIIQHTPDNFDYPHGHRWARSWDDAEMVEFAHKEARHEYHMVSVSIPVGKRGAIVYGVNEGD